MKRTIVAGLATALVALTAACSSSGEKDAEEQEPLLDLTQFESDAGEKCIPLAGIRSTNIIGNQAIEFKMRSGTSYVNVLPRPCPVLTRNRILSWETSLSQLCHLDILRVLDRVGTDIQMVGACGLGYFHPLPEGATAAPLEEE